MKFETKSYKQYSGEASLQVSPGPVVDLKVHETGQAFRFHGEQIGEHAFVPPPGTAMQSVNFRMSEDGQTLWGINPWSGSFLARFKEFASKEGEPPIWRIQKGGKRSNGKGGSWYAKDKMVFTTIFQIIQNQIWDGCNAVKVYDYSFEADEDGNAKGVGSERSKNFKALRGMLEVCGGEFNIPYSDNILPELETILQGRNATVMLVVENGWVNSVTLPPVGMAPAVAPPPVPQPANPETPVQVPPVNPAPQVPASAEVVAGFAPNPSPDPAAPETAPVQNPLPRMPSGPAVPANPTPPLGE